jgi:hypothetical protein
MFFIPQHVKKKYSMVFYYIPAIIESMQRKGNYI